MMKLVLVTALVVDYLPPTYASSFCETCRGPIHSWQTLPVSFHSSERISESDGGFSSEEVDSIARYPLVTIEKWQGDTASDFVWEEDAMVASARQIKAVSPNTTVIAWLDSSRVYTGWMYPADSDDPTAVNHTFNPDANPNCATGHFRAAETLEANPDTFLLRNTSDLLAIDSYSGCHVFDFSRQDARDYWKGMCLALTASGVIDGCGADASWQGANVSSAKSSWGLDTQTAAKWSQGHQGMMRDTMKALGDGLLVGKNDYEVSLRGDLPLRTLRESSRVARLPAM